jgi:hypothetical protein
MSDTSPPAATGRKVPAERDTRLRDVPLVLARAAWLLVTGAVVVLDLAGIPVTYLKIQTPCTGCRADSGPPTVDQARVLHEMGVSLQFWASYETIIMIIVVLVYIGMGVLLFLRRSDDRMAIFASLMLVTFGGAAVSGTMQALPDTHLALWLPVYGADVVGQIAFVVFFFVFPDGRFVLRWTMLPALLWSLSWIAGFFHNPLLDQAAALINNGPLFPVIIASAIAAQIYRYRYISTPLQRKQTKWVVYGFVLGIGGFLLAIFFGNVIISTSVRDNPIVQLIAGSAINALFLFIPVAIAIAILRSRLYDIDVLINRTLVYGSLSAVLAVIYFACVVGTQAVVQALTGQTSLPPVVIVASTLLIAALFTPLRRLLQSFIDQRFYRRKYDAQKTLARFGATLRQEIELNELRGQLVTVVQETMQPTHVSIWLSQPRPAAAPGDYGADRSRPTTP